jgi:hypothetical protein
MIFIPNNVPSSKNSKINHNILSKTVQKYLRSFGIQRYSAKRREVIGYKTIPMTFPEEEVREFFSGIEYPIVLKLHFVRKDRRAADFINLIQILMDLFQAFDIIPDDDMRHIFVAPLEIDGKYYSVDKENPGVYLEIDK